MCEREDGGTCVMCEREDGSSVFDAKRGLEQEPDPNPNSTRLFATLALDGHGDKSPSNSHNDQRNDDCCDDAGNDASAVCSKTATRGECSKCTSMR